MTAPTPQPANYFASIGAVADSELAAATTQIATLTSQLADATAALTVAQSVETADTTQIAALNAQVANLTAELAALQAAPPPPPPPPPTGIVFVDNDFSGSGSFAQVIAPMTYDGPAGAIVASPDGSGGKVAQFTSFQADTISDLWYRFANNAALLKNHPNGIFCRFDIGYDANALADADRNGQFEHWLTRYLDWNPTGGAGQTAGPGGLMGGVGTDFYGEGGVVPSQLVVIDDANTATIPQSATGVILKPNVMQRVQYLVLAGSGREDGPRQDVGVERHELRPEGGFQFVEHVPRHGRGVRPPLHHARGFVLPELSGAGVLGRREDRGHVHHDLTQRGDLT